MSPTPPRRVAVLADTDSRWKWGMLTARQLQPAEVIPYLLERPDSPSERQLTAAGVPLDELVTVRLADLPQVLSERPPEVLVLALPGGGTVAAGYALTAGWPTSVRRPLLVTGYVGVVYEKLVEGALARSVSDVVIANCAEDADRFRRLYRDLRLDPERIVEAALPFLSGPREPVGDRPFTVTFAGQPGVPAGQADRLYLVERLIRHARLHPDRVVNIKLRSAPGERVTHAEPYPYPTLLRRFGELPENLLVTLGEMGEVLRHTDLLVTVSSTAALEAMSAGVATVLLTDFGVREQLGNAYFTGSGCLGSFDEVDAGAAPRVAPAWAQRHGVDLREPDELRDRVARLLRTEPAPLQPYYTMTRSPAYLPRLLASYGLDEAGRPLVGRTGNVRLLRRVVSSTARTFYRTGAEVVAPALRKLGAL